MSPGIVACHLQLNLAVFRPHSVNVFPFSKKYLTWQPPDVDTKPLIQKFESNSYIAVLGSNSMTLRKVHCRPVLVRLDQYEITITELTVEDLQG